MFSYMLLCFVLINEFREVRYSVRVNIRCIVCESMPPYYYVAVLNYIVQPGSLYVICTTRTYLSK